MKLTMLLMLCALIHVSASVYSQQTKLNMSLRDVSVKEVLSQIENQTEFFFLYKNENVDVTRIVSVNIKDKPIEALLDQIFSGTTVSYEVINRQIVLVDRGKSNELGSVQQQKSISGKVTDVSGASLPGVSIAIKGALKGTISSSNGSFTLNEVPADATLVFSFVGMKTQEIKIGGKSVINVKLEEETVGLDEVVAVGYGTMKKSDLTGSLTSISSNSLKEHPMTDFAQVLQGRSAGVSVTNASGAPGELPRIRIRGANSINGSNDPLYIVDGIPGSSDVNPYDVKSVEILKDASATAIYGSRGANGVILITTFRGESDTPKITVSSNIGVSTIGKRYDMLDAASYAELVNKVYGTEMYTSSQISAFKQNGGTDWQDEVFSTGLSQNYQATVSGGSGNTRYMLSTNYIKEVGTLESTNRDKASFRANINTDFGKRLSMSFDITANTGTSFNLGLGSGGGKLNPILQAIMWSPTESVYDADGKYTNADTYGSLGRNPIVCLKEQYGKAKATAFRLNSNAKYKITNDLSFVGNISVGKGNTYDRSYTSVYFVTTPLLKLNSSDEFDWQLQTLLNYNKKFLDKHSLMLTLGFEESSYEERNMALDALGTAIDSPTANITLASSSSVSQGYDKGGLQSFFGRLNYNLASKYFLTATYRADGSSVFTKKNQFDYFPSVGLSWLLSEEQFIKNLNIFHKLKLRGSWGISGNQSGISSASKLSTLKTRKYDYGTGTGHSGTEPDSPANTTLRWERTTQENVGFDMSFFKSKLNVSMDYFTKETHDVILLKKLPMYNGSYNVYQNLGQVNNKGFELSADYQILNKNGIDWNVGFNFSTIKNKVVNLGSDEYILTGDYGAGILPTSAFIIKPGHSLGTFWGVKYLGLWGVNEAAKAAIYGAQPGDSKYEDINNDNVINSSDYQITGDSNPDYSFGINSTISYKNFTLNILVEGVQGRKVLNVMYGVGTLPVGDSRTITMKDGADVWTTSNQGATFPALSSTNVNNLQADRWLQDGSFVKVRNIGLAYTFPRSMTKFAAIKLSVSGQNLITFTKYKGYDPEVSNSGTSDTESGIDFGAYPTPRLITTGVAVTF